VKETDPAKREAIAEEALAAARRVALAAGLLETLRVALRDMAGEPATA
jgi:hypothetical protein